MDASDVLDLSKENVQPLLHGRKTAKLSTVLQLNSNIQQQQELKRQREEFELQIRTYDGPDPLQLRFDYVQWLEQSYPCLGPETNIIPFLEETLVAFKNIEQYKQDPRYVSLVIKYIGTQPNPLEIYNLVYSENIGTKLAMFYKAWAEVLDAHNDIKQANHVFQLGLNAHAEPIEDLEAAQMQFHMSVGRRLLLNGSPSSEEQPVATQKQPERQVLGKLKKVVPGMTRLKMGGAGRMQQQGDRKPLENSQPSGLHVYMDPTEDENNYVKEPSLQNAHFKIKAETMHKENTELPGVWTKKKTKKFATPIPSYPAPPSFPIHVDEGCEEEQHKPSVQLSSRVLQTKKMDVVDASQHVSSLFDTTASSKERHMFCKNKVFLGKTDLQVEEFRAAKHRKDKYGTCLLPRPHGDTIPVCESEPEDSSRVNMFSKSQIYIGNNKEVQLEEVRASQHRKKPSPDDDIPVFIMEPEDKKKRPMYRKHQIYIGGNKEVQLEELRAVQYRTNKSRSSQTTQPSNKAALWTEEIPVCIPCANDKAKPMYRKSEVYIGNNKEVQLEEVRAGLYRKARKSPTVPPHSTTKPKATNCDPRVSRVPSLFDDMDTVPAKSSFAVYTDEIDSAPAKTSFDDSKSKPAAKASFSVYTDDVDSAKLPFPIYSDKAPVKTSFTVYSDDTKPGPAKTSFTVYSDDTKSGPAKTSFTIYSDDNAPAVPRTSSFQDATGPQTDKPNEKSHTKALTFSTSEDESLERKSSSSLHTSRSLCSSAVVKDDSAKKLGLFDTSDKDVSCNLQLQGVLEDEESNRNVYSLLDDMWKSPAISKTKGVKTPGTESRRVLASPLPRDKDVKPSLEPRLDISGVTMNYTVNTKEAMKLVQDMWSSPSPCRNIATATPTKSSDDGITFKKPVSIKKPSAPSVPTITPFKIFTEDDQGESHAPKTPGFQIFTDEDEAPAPPPGPCSALKTPRFEIYTDGTNSELPQPVVPVKTPMFEIYTDDNDDDIPRDKLSCNSQPGSTAALPPNTPFTIFCDEPPAETKSVENRAVALPFNTTENQHQPKPVLLPEEEELATPLGDEENGENMPRVAQLLSLPYVAPTIDLDRQPLGRECKENLPPGDVIKSNKKESRVLNGYLVPSSVPIHVPEGEEMDEEEEMSDMTCNTRAFNFVLPSSTPFINMRNKTGTYPAGTCEINGSFLQEPAPQYNKTQCETQNLSIILEASKEKSSSSSGSSGSGCLGTLNSYFNSCEKKPHTLHPIYEQNGVSGLEESVADLDLNKIDPFDEKLLDELLSQKVQFPLARHRVGYECFFSELHPLKVNSHASFGSSEYTILKELGKGAYARVLMGKVSTDGDKVALKVQRPACVWEWYICKEIENRLKPHSPCLHYYVLPHHIYVFKNSSVLASPWAKYGNLLDLVNMYKIKMGQSLKLQACLKLNLEMTRAIHALHKINIIHGDVKPDNFVICNLMRSGLPTVKLIDFGRSIDMTLYPPGTMFSTVVTTDGFQCTEMKEGREWSYHTDVYGLAGSMCCTLLGKYMNTVKRGARWILADTIPRYLRRDVMEPIFDKLLNSPSHYDITLLEDIIHSLEQELEYSLARSDEGLQTVDNILAQLKL
ncbi:hypothetical protein M8J75_010522 [Diaphorina citri]|nr:hypothetical protein M8J75_010522 [Diaphorina citri]